MAGSSTGAFEDHQYLLLDRFAQLLGLAELAAIDTLAQAGQDSLRRLDPEVSRDQSGLELIEDRLVDLGPALDDLINPLHQLRLGRSHGFLEPVEEAGPFLLLLLWTK